MTTQPTIDKQTNNWPTILFETEYFPFEKKILVRFELITFAVPGIFVTSRLTWARKHRSLNSFLVDSIDSVKQV